jgi:hypothetical protein
VARWSNGLSVDAVSPSTEPTLPADRTFVVQFRAVPRHAPEPRGRVEHLVSGIAARFDTWDELRGFVEQVLIRADGQATEDPGGTR